MNFPNLLQWQWNDYASYHQSRANLLIHIVAVPLFWLGTLGLIGSVIEGSRLMAIGSPVLMVVSMILQGRGHAMEENPPVPFSSAANAISRIFLEQWVNFPRFVLSGAWLRAVLQRTPS